MFTFGWTPLKGAPALYQGRAVVIFGCPGVETTPVRFEDGTVTRVDTQTLQPPTAVQDGYLSRDTLGTAEELWKEALRRLAIIKPLLDLGPGMRSEAVVAQRAAESLRLEDGEEPLSTATLYRWIRQYEATGEVLSLIRRQRKDAGGHHLGETVISVVNKALKPYLKKKDEPGSRKERRKALRLLFSQLMTDIEVACREHKLVVPSKSTVRRMIRCLSPQEQAHATRSGQAMHRSTPLTGTYKDAEYPYSVVQIDHTPLNVMAVDRDGLPIGRPYVTFAIDVRTRIITGMFLSLYPPSTYSVLRCLAQAMLPKTPFLKALGLDYTWPCFGKIRVVHSDNGPDFDSKMLKETLIRRDIDHHFRLKGKPHWGAHIETLMKTNATELKPLPGYTGANTQERQDLDLDPDAEACMTLKDLELWLYNWICNIYNLREHSALKDSPYNVFVKLQNELTGTLDLITGDRAKKLDIDFMPSFTAAVTPKGVVHDYVHYYDPFLERFVGEKEHPGSNRSVKRRFHYDWHDMKEIYYHDDNKGAYVTIGYANLSRESVSYWEQKSAKAELNAQAGPIDEEAIFQAILEGRRIVAEAQNRTRTQRKQAAKLEESEDRRGLRVVAEGPTSAAVSREPSSRPEKKGPHSKVADTKMPEGANTGERVVLEHEDLPNYPVSIKLVTA